MAALFVSDRRSQLERVRPVVGQLRAAGVYCFLDAEAVDALTPLPTRVDQGIARTQALVAWGAVGYGGPVRDSRTVIRPTLKSMAGLTYTTPSKLCTSTINPASALP